MAPVIECRDYSCFIGKKLILDHIAFKIEAGAYLSIIGPNGSGKSTLLKSLLRIGDARFTGELKINGKLAASRSQKELARLLAYVPQPGGRVPPFTVKEFVNLSRYPFSFGNRNDPDEKVARALELTNTASLAQRRLDTLSGGERQRAFLAAALAQDTGTLLLDEPSAFLDPGHAHEMRALLKQLNDEAGLTIVTVTHDLSHLLDAGGKILALQNGRQIHFGAAKDILANCILEKTFSHDFSYLIHPKTGRPVVVA